MNQAATAASANAEQKQRLAEPAIAQYLRTMNIAVEAAAGQASAARQEAARHVASAVTAAVWAQEAVRRARQAAKNERRQGSLVRVAARRSARTAGGHGELAAWGRGAVAAGAEDTESEVEVLQRVLDLPETVAVLELADAFIATTAAARADAGASDRSDELGAPAAAARAADAPTNVASPDSAGVGAEASPPFQAVQALLPQAATLAKLDAVPPNWQAFRLNVLVMVQLGLRRRHEAICNGLNNATSSTINASSDGPAVRVGVRSCGWGGGARLCRRIPRLTVRVCPCGPHQCFFHPSDGAARVVCVHLMAILGL